MVANGALPMRVEIADKVGFSSFNAAVDHLKALDRKGHIEPRSCTSRGIFISEFPRFRSMFDNDMLELDNNNEMAVIVDVAAGVPSFASQHRQKMVSVEQSLFDQKANFSLKFRVIT